MSTYNTFSDNGLIALTNHMKATRALADSNESAIGGLGEDLAALAESTVAALAEKQDTLTFDADIVEGSTNPVYGGIIYEHLDMMAQEFVKELERKADKDHTHSIINAEVFNSLVE